MKPCHVTVCLFTGLSLIIIMIITMAKLNKMCWLAFEVLALLSLVLYHRPPLLEGVPSRVQPFLFWLVVSLVEFGGLVGFCRMGCFPLLSVFILI